MSAGNMQESTLEPGQDVEGRNTLALLDATGVGAEEC